MDIIEQWCDFGPRRVYILMAIARRAHNPELTNSTEIIHRTVIRDEDGIEDAYEDLVARCNRHDYTFRIYLTVNARNTVDAHTNFVRRLVGWSRDLLNGDEAAERKLKGIDSRWKSELHKTPSRDDEYFIFDVDDVTPAEQHLFCRELASETDIQHVQQTPNGYHVITDPFDYTSWEPPVEYDDLDTDGMMFVEEL